MSARNCWFSVALAFLPWVISATGSAAPHWPAAPPALPGGRVPCRRARRETSAPRSGRRRRGRRRAVRSRAHRRHNLDTRFGRRCARSAVVAVRRGGGGLVAGSDGANGLAAGRLSAAKQASTSATAKPNASTGSLNVVCAVLDLDRARRGELLQQPDGRRRARSPPPWWRRRRQSRRSECRGGDQLDGKGRLRLELPGVGAEAEPVTRRAAHENELQRRAVARGAWQPRARRCRTARCRGSTRSRSTARPSSARTRRSAGAGALGAPVWASTGAVGKRACEDRSRGDPAGEAAIPR